MPLEDGPKPGIAYTFDEAAVFMRTTVTALKKRADRRRLQFTWVGRERRLTKEDIEANYAARREPIQNAESNARQPRRQSRRIASVTPVAERSFQSRPGDARRRREAS